MFLMRMVALVNGEHTEVEVRQAGRNVRDKFDQAVEGHGIQVVRSRMFVDPITEDMVQTLRDMYTQEGTGE